MAMVEVLAHRVLLGHRGLKESLAQLALKVTRVTQV